MGVSGWDTLASKASTVSKGAADRLAVRCDVVDKGTKDHTWLDDVINIIILRNGRKAMSRWLRKERFIVMVVGWICVIFSVASRDLPGFK